MEPIVDGLEQEFAGQIQVMRLDANDPTNSQLMEALELRGHPAFAVIDAEGQVTARFFGPQPIEALRDAMQAVIE
ncbi:MAG: thioredoxin family protein [Chloroflexi bacterium]|nr:thioredoxin family protein [Chloroflexota bacterium]